MCTRGGRKEGRKEGYSTGGYSCSAEAMVCAGSRRPEERPIRVSPRPSRPADEDEARPSLSLRSAVS